MTQNYRIADWDSYSKSFQSVMPSEMLALNSEAAEWLTGDVADFGCGGGKLIPFALGQAQVTSYTGIDMSLEMVQCARWVAAQIPGKICHITHGRIESITLDPIDSAVSINSYYTWRNPEAILRHIFQQLLAKATFVLATINPAIDMPELLQAAEKELLAHPDWEEFKRHNLEIAQSKDANFIEMDDLIGQLRSVGFRVLEAHQKRYGGGLNFIVCEKI